MNDEALNRAFNRVRHRLENHAYQTEVFRRVRDTIDSVVQNCADNVKVRINIDVLNAPVIISAGRAENVLDITIKGEGIVIYTWEKETWAKYFADCWSSVTNLTKQIVSVITSEVSQMVSQGQHAIKAITEI